MSPFSEATRKEIKKRAKYRSEISGRTDRPLHAMHFNHARTEGYDTPPRGVLVTIVEHLVFHLLFRGKAHRIGLKECQNDWAIDILQQNSTNFLEKVGKLDELPQEMRDSKIKILEYLHKRKKT